MMRLIASWLTIAFIWSMLLLLYMWRGGQSLWFLLAVVGFIAVQGMFIQFMGLRRAYIERSFTPARPTAGEEVVVHVRVSIQSTIPLVWLTVSDAISGSGTRHIKFLMPGTKRSFSYTYRIIGLSRGIYHFRDAVITSGDLFGWFKRSIAVASEDKLIVTPALANVHERDNLGAANEGEWSPQQQVIVTHFRGPEVRNYIPGDPWKSIHWKSYAKYGRLHTLLPDQEEASAWAVVLDTGSFDEQRIVQNKTSKDRTGKLMRNVNERFEYSLSYTAGLLQHGINTGLHPYFLCAGYEHCREVNDFTELYKTMMLLAETEPNPQFHAAHLMRKSLPEHFQSMQLTIVTGRIDDKLVEEVSSSISKGTVVELILIHAGTAQKLAATQDELYIWLERIGVKILNVLVPVNRPNISKGWSGKESAKHVIA
ncbi:DUF58 domain-containing protein [Paenibacillus sediminis]|uniref:Uncharacterized protein (DUF58 family) n=1 Tax=Paenibacillus sediminis TaxID=664909 RepID=A0ABS4H635_9BACL|nr:DUF58 domain-containing protein [Paenibacillus sediminis]MBP1937989.1 uncharacterized protein (DUF58 family) [Paenibacillus sediminis]